MSQPATAESLGVSRETFSLLTGYVELVRKWNSSINLISKGSLQEIWQRHIVDSLQVLHAAPKNAMHWADLGTGAGLPGMVVAIAALEMRPDLTVKLVEADQRKAAFLRQAVAILGVPANVMAQRIENMAPLGADVLSARALAPLADLLGYSEAHLLPGGNALFPKGKSWGKEVEDARATWSFDLDVVKSRTAPDAVILKIRNVARV